MTAKSETVRENDWLRRGVKKQQNVKSNICSYDVIKTERLQICKLTVYNVTVGLKWRDNNARVRGKYKKLMSNT